MSKDDLIIALIDEISSYNADQVQLMLNDIAGDLGVATDAISEHLEEALQDTDYELVRKGETRALIRKRPTERFSHIAIA